MRSRRHGRRPHLEWCWVEKATGRTRHRLSASVERIRRGAVPVSFAPGGKIASGPILSRLWKDSETPGKPRLRAQLTIQAPILCNSPH